MDLTNWASQYLPISARESDGLPKPVELGALASFSNASVIYDGIVLPSGPDDGRRFIPDWAYGGFTHAYNALEDLLVEIGPRFGDAIEARVPADILNLTESLRKPNDMLRFGDRACNYLAWTCISRTCPIVNEQTLTQEYPSSVEVVIGLDWSLARSVMEENRPNGMEAVERVHSDVLTTLDEIQLPLILATAVSRIDRADQLPLVLYDMNVEFNKARARFAEFETLLADPHAKGSAQKIRRLHAELTLEVKQRVGSDLSPAGLIRELPSLLSLRAGSTLLSLGKLLPRWNRPELSLLGHWTRSSALDTIGRLRKIFRTEGDDAEWMRAATILQRRGTLAWYPANRLSKS